MIGRRREDLKQDAEGWSPRGPEEVAPGDYWKLVRNNGAIDWYYCTPSGWFGNLSGHVVTEHEDGTITVSPSILTGAPVDSKRYYHGFLRAGEWIAA